MGKEMQIKTRVGKSLSRIRFSGVQTGGIISEGEFGNMNQRSSGIYALIPGITGQVCKMYIRNVYAAL